MIVLAVFVKIVSLGQFSHFQPTSDPCAAQKGHKGIVIKLSQLKGDITDL